SGPPYRSTSRRAGAQYPASMSAVAPLPFAAAARLPAPGDNVAIAIRRLDAGTSVALPDGPPRALAHTVLEGHRFAVRPIARGERLTSWGLPFGTAVRDIAPGDYVSNKSILEALAVRQLAAVALPAEPNFTDHLVPFRLDEAAFRPAPAVAPAGAARGRHAEFHRRPRHHLADRQLRAAARRPASAIGARPSGHRRHGAH